MFFDSGKRPLRVRLAATDLQGMTATECQALQPGDAVRLLDLSGINPSVIDRGQYVVGDTYKVVVWAQHGTALMLTVRNPLVDSGYSALLYAGRFAVVHDAVTPHSLVADVLAAFTQLRP